jgi:hypothetical protein
VISTWTARKNQANSVLIRPTMKMGRISTGMGRRRGIELTAIIVTQKHANPMKL